MAYTKTTWVNGETPINADNLNNIENGIETNDANIMKINDKLLKTENINLTINTDYVYSIDWDYTCIKIGNIVFLSINTIAFKVGDIPNFGVFLSNLPKPSTGHIFYLAPRHANIEHFRVAINQNGQLVRHYTIDPEHGISSENQYHGLIIYFTND